MDELVLGLLEEGLPVRTFPHRGEWYDIGNAKDLEEANVAFAERRQAFLPAAGGLAGVA
jgi:NDP-sugar pyrophosphorylase family protein